MNLKEFAKSRNLTIAKVRELCSSLLGEVPNKLSEDNVVTLDNALAKTAHALLIASGEEPAELTTEVERVIDKIDAQTTYTTTKVIGAEDLKRNVLLYLSYLKNHLIEHKFKLETLAFQVEQSFYNELSHYQHSLYEDGKQRIFKNSEAAYSLFSSSKLTEELNTTQDEELKPLMVDALEYLKTIGL